MEFIKKCQAETYSGDGYSGMEYPSSDKDINFAIIKINCRSPKRGFHSNEQCKELLYIINGNGIMYMKDSDKKIEFAQGDVILINKNECYAFAGSFEAAVPCTPAWTSDQHKYVD